MDAGGLRLEEARGRWVLLSTILGSSMALLDSTVVNVALPSVGRDLGATLPELQWVVNAYTLTLAGLILLGGSLGDRYGRRLVFLVGVCWFAVASALCGLAPSAPVLIAARALQGIGGALLTPGSLAIIQATFSADDRPRAVGLWSGLGGVAGAIGPFVGGWVIAAAGWRWAFLLNLPLAALVVAVTVRHVPETRDDALAAGHRGFDIVGAGLAALGLAGITYALTLATGSDHAVVVSSGVVGVLALGAFLLLERRRSRGHGPPPMLPFDVFSSGEFSAVNVITFLAYAGLGVVTLLLVVQLQVVGGYSPLLAGTALLPVTILMLLLSSRAAALAQRIGPRRLMAVGLALAAAGVLLLLRVGPDPSWLTDVLPAGIVFGLGLSAMVAPLTAVVLATVDVHRAGVASGINNAVARTASLLAVAAVPPLAGLTGDAYRDPQLFNAGFDRAMIVAAALFALAALLSALTVRGDVLRAAPAPTATTHCAVGAPPLQPGPAHRR